MQVMMPGAWRRQMQERIRNCRIDIAESVRRESDIRDVVRHTRSATAERLALNDLFDQEGSRRLKLQLELRRCRCLMRLTKPCPRCKGRGQKFDRRRRKRWSGRVMRPCSLCQAQGYLWVHP